MTKKGVRRIDASPILPEKARKDDRGFIFDDAIVTRSGIFTYFENGKEIKEFRPPDEVSNTKSLDSLKGSPIVLSHKIAFANRENIKGQARGAVLSAGRYDENGNVKAELVIYTSDVTDKYKELSCGYTCDVFDEAGDYNGEKYDRVQKNIIYNHLAIVSKGRAGNARLNLDGDLDFSNDGEEIKMDVDEKKLLQEIADLKAQNTQLQAKLNEQEAKTAELNAEMEKLKAEKDAEVSEIKDRADWAVKAGEVGVKVDSADKSTDIKRKVVSLAYPSLKTDAQTDEALNGMAIAALSQLEAIENAHKKQLGNIRTDEKELSMRIDSISDIQTFGKKTGK